MRGIEDYYRAIGKRVSKMPTTNSGGKKYANMRMTFSQWLSHEVRNPKPFKSGKDINTVKAIVIHPQLGLPAFLFEEDDSYVECRRCSLMEVPHALDADGRITLS